MTTINKQIPAGYKKTEVGVIPISWDVINIGESGLIKARIGWQGLTTAEYLEAGDYYLITGTDFKNGYIDWSNCVYVEKERYVQDKYIQIQANDVLVTKDGTIGKVAFIENVPKETTLNSGVYVIRPKDKSFNERYFYYVLMSDYFTKFLAELTAGSTISHLYQKDFVFFNFPLPSLSEQTAIATALSDMDALIAAQEQLITKKRAIKQGAMQELLEEKEGWEEKRLGEMLMYEQPTKYIVESTEYNSNAGTPVLTAGKSLFLGYTNEKEGIFEDIPVIIFDDFTTSIQFVDFKFKVKSSAMKILKNRSARYNLIYLYNLMRLIKFDATDHKRYWISEYQNIEVNVPPITEQIRIATILSDMDAEIEQLSEELAKYRDMKKGMMGELLTGKRRLKH